MIEFSDKYRSDQQEIMDDLEFQGREMRENLDDIRIMNKWFGGNNITLDGVHSLLKSYSKTVEIIILDIGCGDGQMLRECITFAQTKGYKVRGIGLDFNKNILDLAESKSQAYSNIKFQKVDVFSELNIVPNCDIALFTLFLHHFKNDKIEELLKSVLTKANKGLVINDLHRNRQAFNLFKIISKLFLKTKTAHHDGLVSIARGFKKHELKQISENIPNQKSYIRWRWAFRYQWIIEKA